MFSVFNPSFLNAFSVSFIFGWEFWKLFSNHSFWSILKAISSPPVYVNKDKSLNTNENLSSDSASIKSFVFILALRILALIIVGCISLILLI